MVVVVRLVSCGCCHSIVSCDYCRKYCFLWLSHQDLHGVVVTAVLHVVVVIAGIISCGCCFMSCVSWLLMNLLSCACVAVLHRVVVVAGHVSYSCCRNVLYCSCMCRSHVLLMLSQVLYIVVVVAGVVSCSCCCRSSPKLTSTNNREK